MKQKVFHKSENKINYIWLLAAIFVVSTIFVTIQSASSGAELAHITQEREKITKENLELSSRLMQSTSLTAIHEKSSELGFMRSAKTVYVSGPEPVADLSNQSQN